MQDLHGSIKYVPAIVPATNTNLGTTPLVSAIIDLQGSRGCEFVIVTGTLTDADAVYGVTMDHGDAANLSDAASVPTADLMGTLAGAGFTYANDIVTRKVGYSGTKRYVRLTITPTTTAQSGDSPIAAIAVLWMMKGPQS